MRLIGISGASGSGKSTFAGLLAAELSDQGYVVGIDAMAQPIKRQLRRDGEYFDKARRRRAMQDIGTAHRLIDPDHYIKAFAIRVSRSLADYTIIPDIRFPNEGRYARRSGVLIFVDGSRRRLAGKAAAHESESHFAALMGMADAIVAPQISLDGLAEFARRLVRTGGHNKS